MCEAAGSLVSCCFSADAESQPQDRRSANHLILTFDLTGVAAGVYELCGWDGMAASYASVGKIRVGECFAPCFTCQLIKRLIAPSLYIGSFWIGVHVFRFFIQR